MSRACRDSRIEVAVAEMQRALDGLGKWARTNCALMAPAKTEALMVTLDPRQGGDKPCELCVDRPGNVAGTGENSASAVS